MVDDGPAGAQTSEDGTRYYPLTHPDTGQEVRLLSVTSGIPEVDSDGLKLWTAGLAATAAFEELPKLTLASRRPDCGRTWARCEHEYQETCPGCPCRVCEPCLKLWMQRRFQEHNRRRTGEGKMVHKWIEKWIDSLQPLDTYAVQPDPIIAPYIKSFREFVAAYALTQDDFLWSEGTAVNWTDEWAGTADGAIRFTAGRTLESTKLVAWILGIKFKEALDGKRTASPLIDWKTSEGTSSTPNKLYPKMAYQSAAYRRGEFVRIKKTGEWAPMEPTDGGLIIQLRPDAWQVRLLDTSDAVYQAFLMGHRYSRHAIEQGTRIVSPRLMLIKDIGPCKWPPSEPKPAATRKSAAPAAAKKAATPPAAASAPSTGRPPAKKAAGRPIIAPANAARAAGNRRVEEVPLFETPEEERARVSAAPRTLRNRVLGYPGATLTDEDIPF